GRVQPDPEDPGPEVQDVGERVPRPPALDERFLGRVLGVVAVSEQVQESADEFVPHLGEGAGQAVPGRGKGGRIRGPPFQSLARAGLSHVSYLYDGRPPRTDCGQISKRRDGRTGHEIVPDRPQAGKNCNPGVTSRRANELRSGRRAIRTQNGSAWAVNHIGPSPPFRACGGERGGIDKLRHPPSAPGPMLAIARANAGARASQSPGEHIQTTLICVIAPSAVARKPRTFPPSPALAVNS